MGHQPAVSWLDWVGSGLVGMGLELLERTPCMEPHAGGSGERPSHWRRMGQDGPLRPAASAGRPAALAPVSVVMGTNSWLKTWGKPRCCFFISKQPVVVLIPEAWSTRWMPGRLEALSSLAGCQ